jgi:hypothetical protein
VVALRLFEQDHWARQMVKTHGAGDGDDDAAAAPSPSYWRAVGLLMSQADGLMAGYSARLAELGPEAPLERLTKWDFLVLNALGDMDDLLGACGGLGWCVADNLSREKGMAPLVGGGGEGGEGECVGS